MLLAEKIYNKPAEKLTTEERETLIAASTLAGGLAAGATSGNPQAAIVGMETSKRAVENNYLSAKEVEDFYKELLDAEKNGRDTKPIFEKYQQISKANDEAMLKECGNDATCYAKHLNAMSVGQQTAQDYIDPKNPISWGADLSFEKRGQLSSVVDKENIHNAIMALPEHVKVVYGSPIIAVGSILAPEAMGTTTVAAGAIGGVADVIDQLIEKKGDVSQLDYKKVAIGTIWGAATKDFGYWIIPANGTKDFLMSRFYDNKSIEKTREDVVLSIISSTVGAGIGHATQIKLDKHYNNEWRLAYDELLPTKYPIYRSPVISAKPAVFGNISDSISSSLSKTLATKAVEQGQDKNYEK